MEREEEVQGCKYVESWNGMYICLYSKLVRERTFTSSPFFW
jgi:hypothetical protein